MKLFTLALSIVFIFIFAPLFVQGQEVCPHTGGWEKSGENEQHVTIIIVGDTITFIPDKGWKIFEICLKAGTDVYYQSFEGGTSDTIIINSPSGQDVSHGAALMVQTQEPTNTPTEDPTSTPTIEVTNTPVLPTNTPLPTPRNTPISSNTPTSTPWSGTPTPWPTKECTNPGGCNGTG